MEISTEDLARALVRLGWSATTADEADLQAARMLANIEEYRYSIPQYDPGRMYEDALGNNWECRSDLKGNLFWARPGSEEEFPFGTPRQPLRKLLPE